MKILKGFGFWFQVSMISNFKNGSGFGFGFTEKKSGFFTGFAVSGFGFRFRFPCYFFSCMCFIKFHFILFFCNVG